MNSKFWTLSFSGAGHLLPYHLGVARILIDSPQLWPKIRGIAGSSSGAIAATLAAFFPQRLEEYAEQFLADGGRGLSSFREILQEEVGTLADSSLRTETNSIPPSLFICTTKSSDGSMHLFEFNAKNMVLRDPLLMNAILASCTIPKSFHPFDILRVGSKTLSYPDGIEIDGELYCDGGIAAPAPPTMLETDRDCAGHIIVSPISGNSVSWPGSSTSSPLVIRPHDDSWAIPLVELTARCGTFRIKPSIQNLQAAVASLGAIPPHQLRKWYERGAEDAEKFLKSSFPSK